jgi:hypothetical protein
MQSSEHLPIKVCVIAILALVAGLLAGCGGGGEEEAASSGPLTKAEFLKQGNALCDAVLAQRDSRAVRAYRDRIAEYKKLPKAGQERVIGEVASEVDLPLYRKLIRELGEMKPPEKDDDFIDRMLSKYEAILDRLSKNPEDLSEAEPLAPNAEATSYGLVSCSL